MAIGLLVARHRVRQRDQVVRESGARAPQAALQTADLRATAHDLCGGRAYITVRQLVEEGLFPSEQAVRSFLSRHRVPRYRLGRKVVIRARDLAGCLCPVDVQSESHTREGVRPPPAAQDKTLVSRMPD